MLPKATAVAAPLPPPDEGYGYLGWIAALLAGLSASGFALKQWFYPKLKLNCEIENGESSLTGASSPAVTAPELAFTIQIETGEANAPAGRLALATGEQA